MVIVGIVSNDTTSQPKTQVTQQNDYSYAFKLAALEIGNNNPDQSLISNFKNVLKQLTTKCTTETEDQIADYIYKTKTMITDKGGSISFLEAANSINDSIPKEAIGVVKCAEIAAGFVTLYES